MSHSAGEVETGVPEAVSSVRAELHAPVIRARSLAKVYGDDPATVVRALDGVSLDIAHGEHVAIMGASGSGKSTMMNILGLLDVPTSGRYELNGFDVSAMDDAQLTVARNRLIGFVFQSFNLIRRTSALANVELPLAYAGVRPRERRERALAALAQVGVADRAKHLPNELSGGQQQRVAVARALAGEPALILADEPTGNLDSTSTADVLDLLDAVHDAGRTIVVITHEDEVAERASRVIRMRDGKIIEDVRLEEAPPTREAWTPTASACGGAPTGSTAGTSL
ncbi:ABC transporter ATP-binding protein [Nocardioides renjunii]|uniref:ABC transporter ATP-binding protein n=1 Tax=Nocardioides renjunii TaxID=3095075 RepID=UPI002AFFE714|nr:ABC transporter ATP-binding protein [Nocardioides sp. S-34]WQQ20461.1 ABC transporter ATP-binding protein [Nocardioides sp. S-34]